MERSRARTKNWPNTIENMRNKRIEDRYRVLEEAEVLFTSLTLFSLLEDVSTRRKMLLTRRRENRL
jgi:hypothetical protein